MFRFENVTYKDILQIGDLTIGEGLIAILGPSGSGKTTLLRLMDKMISPTGGHIYFRGTDLDQIPSVAHRRNVMMLSQNPVMYPGTLRDNLVVGHRFQSKPLPEDLRLREILAQVELDKELDSPVDILSGGEKQRLALGRVFLLDPQVYLLDEPSAALDETAEDAIIAMVAAHNRDNQRPTVMVTHSRNIARKYADTIVELDRILDGKKGGEKQSQPKSGKEANHE